MLSDRADHARTTLDCPSAQPDMAGARPFGVISGTVHETRIAFFKKSALDGFDWRQRFANAEATKLLRFGARCEEGACVHHDGSACSLGGRVAQMEAVVDALPSCLLRPSCRWHAEQGPEVCRRCPQVITSIPAGNSALNRVAMGQQARL